MQNPKALIRGKIGIQSKPQFLVECFGAIDVGNREKNDFQFHVHNAVPTSGRCEQALAHMVCPAEAGQVELFGGDA